MLKVKLHVSAEKGGKVIKYLKGDLPEEDCDPVFKHCMGTQERI